MTRGLVARRGLVAASVGIALALVGAAGWSHAAVRERSVALAQGQGSLLAFALRDALLADTGAPEPTALDHAALESATASLVEQGLVRVAVVDGGAVVARAGAAGDIAEPWPTLGANFLEAGDRALFLVPVPPGSGMRPPRGGPPDEGPPGGGPPDEGPPGGGPPDEGPPGDGPPADGPPADRPPGEGRPGGHARGGLRGGPPLLLLEFTPTWSLELRARSERTLWAAALGATLLLAVSLATSRAWARAQLVEADLAQSRHLASLGQVTAVLAHEIRNPLAALKGHAQLLAELVPPEDPRRARADRVVSEAVRLERLTTDLLDFARTARVERVDVDPVALARSVADAAPGPVRIDAAGAPTRWSLDPDRIRQVLVNLVDNAVQADPEGVELVVDRDGASLRIEVRDRGPGLPDGDPERLFEPFVTTRTRGTGLGLAVARRLVRLHGGSLVAAGRDGGGAVFTVLLPES